MIRPAVTVLITIYEAARDAMKAAGFRQAILWVHPDSARACRFYEIRGWVDAGVERTERVLGVEVAEVRLLPQPRLRTA
jgi:hypothetical protein